MTGCTKSLEDQYIINGYEINYSNSNAYIISIDMTFINKAADVVGRLAYDDRYIYVETTEHKFYVIDTLERIYIYLFSMDSLLFEKLVNSKALSLKVPKEVIAQNNLKLIQLDGDYELYEFFSGIGLSVNDSEYYLIYNINEYYKNIPSRVVKIEYDDRYIFAKQLVSYCKETELGYEEIVEQINYWYIDTYTKERFGPYTYLELYDIQKNLNIGNIETQYIDYGECSQMNK